MQTVNHIIFAVSIIALFSACAAIAAKTSENSADFYVCPNGKDSNCAIKIPEQTSEYNPVMKGRAAIRSNILLERHAFDFAVLHFGDHNLICAVNARISDDAFNNMHKDLRDAFAKGDTTEVMRIMNISFGGNSYSLRHLFKNQQRRIDVKVE